MLQAESDIIRGQAIWPKIASFKRRHRSESRQLIPFLYKHWGSNGFKTVKKKKIVTLKSRSLKHGNKKGIFARVSFCRQLGRFKEHLTSLLFGFIITRLYTDFETKIAV